MGNNAGGYAATKTGTYQWLAVYSGDCNNNGASDTFGCEPETVSAPCAVGSGQYGTCGFWQSANGQSVICSFGTGASCTQLGNWLASNYPDLFGCSNSYTSSYLKQCGFSSVAGLTNSQIATLCSKLSTSGTNANTYAQAFACALGIYADTCSFGGNTTAQGCGFNVTWPGGSGGTYNVGSNNGPFGVSKNTSLSVCSILQNLNNNFTPSNGSFYSGSSSSTTAACNVLSGINTAGGVKNASLSDAGLAYSPDQILTAYGISSLGLDGTGQTIAIVDAYDDPNIFASLDAFDGQFGVTASGPSLYAQYGPASSFLTVLNQSGQTSPLPATDPSGQGTDNWEVEEALDVEWTHAIAPGAQIILVEANSQSLSDLMASVGTAASQPGVSVVSMSWGFAEGQAVFAADEAQYDSTFNVPGVTFVASTGDYGTADPEYPAFSPNVVAVGGTTLNLNADNSYNSETGWGYYSNSIGMSIGSGGGISLYELEPAYQQGVQSTGSRTTPDVSFDADPATGAWIADTYNLDLGNPFEVVGGTSLSAPAWAGLLALANQGRVAAGEQTLNSSTPTDAQQALYMLPQADYNVIASGSNGYTANAGYNLVTGLGTPVANRLVGDLIAYQGAGTTYAGPTVRALQDATLSGNWTGGGGTSNAFNVFGAPTVSSNGLGYGQGAGAASTISTPLGGTSAQAAAANHSAVTPVTTIGITLGLTPGSLPQNGPAQSLGWATNFTVAGPTSQSPAAATITPVSTGLGTQLPAWSPAPAAVTSLVSHTNPSGSPATDRDALGTLISSRPRTGLFSNAVLDELAADAVLWPAQQGNGTITIPVLPPDGVTRDPKIGDPLPQVDRPLPPTNDAAGIVVLGLAAGLWARGTGLLDPRKRRSGGLRSRTKSR